MNGTTIIAGIVFLILLGYLIKDYSDISQLAQYLSYQELYLIDALEGKSV